MLLSSAGGLILDFAVARCFENLLNPENPEIDNVSIFVAFKVAWHCSLSTSDEWSGRKSCRRPGVSALDRFALQSRRSRTWQPSSGREGEDNVHFVEPHPTTFFRNSFRHLAAPLQSQPSVGRTSIRPQQGVLKIFGAFKANIIKIFLSSN